MKDIGANKGVPPFSVIAIVQEEERLRSVLDLARENDAVGFGLMLRDPEHRPAEVGELAEKALQLPPPANVTLIANGCDVEGLEWRHLTVEEWKADIEGEGGRSGSFGCSVHSAGEIALAERLRPDYLLLSPIFPTTSKPGAAALGIDALEDCVTKTSIPILALGGIVSADRAFVCLNAGAFGIAGITLFNPRCRIELQEILSSFSAANRSK